MDKQHVAKKMKKGYSIGEDLHKTFKKFGKAVGKIKTPNFTTNKPAF